MKSVDGIEHASSVGKIAKIEVNLGGRRVRDQSYSTVASVEACSIQNEIEHEVKFALNVVWVEIVGLI